MTYQPTAIFNGLMSLPKLPGWVTSGSAETLDNMAFRFGAALTVLDALVLDPRHGVPFKLLANRLALTTATATSKLEGRMAREADIRDAFHLTPPGEARGPDGDLLVFWREAARLRLTGRDWHEGLKHLVGPNFENDVVSWIEGASACAKTHGPLTASVSAIRLVLEADERAERIACLLSNVVIARALNWTALLPISTHHLTKAILRDLLAEGQRAELRVQQSILESIEDSIRVSRDLSCKAAALRAESRKLRAKGSAAAIDLFLTEDAVAPSTMLSPMIQGTSISMTDRAARRFCGRLVALGVARELTGRSTFRLYGITP